MIHDPTFEEMEEAARLHSWEAKTPDLTEEARTRALLTGNPRETLPGFAADRVLFLVKVCRISRDLKNDRLEREAHSELDKAWRNFNSAVEEAKKLK